MEKYRSRKFILTLLVLTATVGLAIIGKMTTDIGTVFAALIVSYNGMQGWIDKGNA